MAIRLTESGAIRLTESGSVRVTQSHITGTEWPDTLPQAFLLNSYSATRPSTLLKSQPEAGPAIHRRRFTAAVMPFSGTMMMTTAQKIAFYTFYDETLLGGAVAFVFPAQDGSGGVWDCRFTADPEEAPVSAAHWRISMAMERLP